jgi:hypothetical protein
VLRYSPALALITECSMMESRFRMLLSVHVLHFLHL